MTEADEAEQRNPHSEGEKSSGLLKIPLIRYHDIEKEKFDVEVTIGLLLF